LQKKEVRVAENNFIISDIVPKIIKDIVLNKTAWWMSK